MGYCFGEGRQGIVCAMPSTWVAPGARGVNVGRQGIMLSGGCLRGGIVSRGKRSRRDFREGNTEESCM
jgi:hypothetical protein